MVEHRPNLPLLDLLRHGAFRRLLLAQGVSEVGDWFTNVALMLLLYQLLGHPGAAALVLFAKLVPRALVYPFGGLMADRLDRRQVMAWTCLARGGLALSLLLAQSPDHVWWVLLATSFSQALASVFNPTTMAALPTVVPKERLGQANSLIGMAKEIAFLAGPVLGVGIMTLGGIHLAFVVDAGTFVVAALLLSRLKLVASGQPTRASARPRHDLLIGWRVIRDHAGLRVVFAAQVLAGTMIAALNALLVPLLVLHWRAPDTLLGLLYGAIGAGCLIGSFIIMRLDAKRHVSAVLAALGLMGLTAFSLGLAPWLWSGVILLVVAGVATMVGDVAASSHIQATVDGDRLGRVFGLLFWMFALGQAIGAGIGWFASTISPGLLIIGLSVVLLAATPWLAARQRRTNQPAPCRADTLVSSLG